MAKKGKKKEEEKLGGVALMFTLLPGILLGLFVFLIAMGGKEIQHTVIAMAVSFGIMGLAMYYMSRVPPIKWLFQRLSRRPRVKDALRRVDRFVTDAVMVAIATILLLISLKWMVS